MKKTSVIADVTGKGLYIDPKIKDLKFLEGIMHSVKKCIPSIFLYAVDEKTDTSCLDMEQMYSQFSARPDFSDYLPDKFTPQCKATLLTLINTCSGLAVQEMLSKMFVYTRSLQNALSDDETEGTIVETEMISSETLARLRMCQAESSAKSNGFKPKKSKLHINLGRSTLIHTNAIKKLEDQCGLVYSERNLDLIQDLLFKAYPFILSHCVQTKCISTKLVQVNSTQYMCAMSFQTTHKVTQQPPRDIRCINVVKMCEDPYTKFQFTHSMEAIIQKCTQTYSFLVDKPSSIQSKLTQKPTTQVINLQNIVGDIKWTASSEFYAAVYSNQLVNEKDAWVYNNYAPKQSYYCIFCVELIQRDSLNRLTCGHFACVSCIKWAQTPNCQTCLQEVYVVYPAQDAQLQVVKPLAVGNLQVFSGKCKQSLTKFDRIYMVQSFVSALQQAPKANAGTLNSEEYNELQQLRKQLACKAPKNRRSAIHEDHKAEDPPQRKLTRLHKNSSTVQQEIIPQNDGTTIEQQISQRNEDNLREDIKDQFTQDNNIAKRQTMTRRVEVDDGGNVLVTEEIFSGKQTVYNVDEIGAFRDQSILIQANSNVEPNVNGYEQLQLTNGNPDCDMDGDDPTESAEMASSINQQQQHQYYSEYSPRTLNHCYGEMVAVIGRQETMNVKDMEFFHIETARREISEEFDLLLPQGNAAQIYSEVHLQYYAEHSPRTISQCYEQLCQLISKREIMHANDMEFFHIETARRKCVMPFTF